MKYGVRFKEMRDRAQLSQEAVAAVLNLKKPRGSSVSNIERAARPPSRAATLIRHATALRCEPWELLAGVATQHDELRAPTPLSNEELSALLWGLAFVPANDRRIVLDQFQGFLNALRPGEVPAQARQHEPAMPVKGGKTFRRKTGR